jgi:hypothetical protein
MAFSATSTAGERFQKQSANTSPASSDNEGGGVFRRSRSRNLIRAVYRITA